MKNTVIGLILLSLTMLLTGCGSTSSVGKPPESLLRECAYPDAKDGTWDNKYLSDLTTKYHDSLVQCNKDKAALRKLYGFKP